MDSDPSRISIAKEHVGGMQSIWGILVLDLCLPDQDMFEIRVHACLGGLGS